MNEISLFHDKNMSEPIEGSIEFDPIPAGQSSTKTIYLYNNIKFPISVGLEIIGSDLSITLGIEEIKPKTSQAVEIIMSPKTTRMQPIKGSIKIQIKYMVT